MTSKRPLKPIMLVRPPISILYEESFWDELSEAGIHEVAVQWLALLDDQGDRANLYPQPEDEHPRGLAAVGGTPVRRTPVAAYDPNPGLYEGLWWQPPEMPARLRDEAARLREALQMGVRKGFALYVTDDKGYFLQGGFGTGRRDPAARRPSFCDPQVPAFAVARARDTLANYPEFSGIYLDGPDHRWEIRPGHRDDMWAATLDDEHSRRFAESVGIGMERVLEGRDRFQDRLRSLTPEAVDDFVKNRAGLFGSLEWWADDSSMLDWMRFKSASIEWHLSAIYSGIKEHLPGLQVGSSSRMPAIAPLTGHDLRRKRRYTDFQMPKEYWWSGGVAGFRGTVTNWVETLVEWNPGLSEEDAARWFSAAFDHPMPADYPVSEYEKEATDEWFRTSVADQTRKMVAGAGGPDRVVPWVGLEHFGSNWLTARELRRLLAVMQDHGITRYSYFVFNSVKPDIWSVITEFSRGVSSRNTQGA